MGIAGVTKVRALGLSSTLLWCCTFGSKDANDGASIEGPETETGSATGGNGSSVTSGSAGETIDGGEGGASTGTITDDTEGDVDPTSADTPRARLVFVDEAPIDLGVHALWGQDLLVLELTNQGDAAGSILGGGDPPPPLIWAGDVFPGTDGSCQGLIPPGATCTVALAVAPGSPGLVRGSVEVRFADMIGSGSARTQIELTATGEGPNLIENPDAESDPPGAILTGWAAGGSSFHTSTEHNHGAGSLSFAAGDASSPELGQDVVLDERASSIDALPMRFVFSGWSRSRDDGLNDDPHDIRLIFLDDSNEELGTQARTDMDHDGWEETTFDAEIPAGTRRVRVVLRCDRNLGSNCSAWFDDFFGAIAYAEG